MCAETWWNSLLVLDGAWSTEDSTQFTVDNDEHPDDNSAEQFSERARMAYQKARLSSSSSTFGTDKYIFLLCAPRSMA